MIAARDYVVVRNLFASLMLALVLVRSTSAQNWADKMFDTNNHDFGTLARGAHAVFRFKVKNLYKETLHITAVRSSCGCTSASIEKATLATHEEGAIVAQFNTRSFLGQRGATITVTIDRPYSAEVQLRVQGNVRGDVVFQPGVVQFGSVDQGSIAEQHVTVTYAGRDNWKIVDVQSGCRCLEVEMKPVAPQPGRVTYDLLVRMKDDTPVGYLHEQLVLITNDRRYQRIPLPIQGRVVPEITVSPASLYLGELRTGEEKTSKIVLRGKRPFRIVSVACDDNSFRFKSSRAEKKYHLVEIAYKPKHSGKVEQVVHLRTDRGKGVEAKLVVYAQVTAADEAHAKPDDVVGKR